MTESVGREAGLQQKNVYVLGEMVAFKAWWPGQRQWLGLAESQQGTSQVGKQVLF